MSTKRSMYGVQRRCLQLQIHDPALNCKLFDTLAKPILCYCCEVWTVLGTKAALESMERIQLEFLKILLGVQVHTKTLHEFADFGRYPLHITWQSQAARYMQQLESFCSGRLLAHAFITDTNLPKKLSWQSKLVTQLQPFLAATPTEKNPERQPYSLHAA